jgi:hypothetical protein
MKIKQPWLKTLFYENSYSLLPNGNREYTVEAFDFNYKVEVFVAPDDGEYIVVNWKYYDVVESDRNTDHSWSWHA